MKHVMPALLALLSLAGCQATSHPLAAAATSAAAVVASGAALESTLDEPGPVTVETVVAADWVVDRSGLINLDHPPRRPRSSSTVTSRSS